ELPARTTSSPGSISTLTRSSAGRGAPVYRYVTWLSASTLTPRLDDRRTGAACRRPAPRPRRWHRPPNQDEARDRHRTRPHPWPDPPPRRQRRSGPRRGRRGRGVTTAVVWAPASGRHHTRGPRVPRPHRARGQAAPPSRPASGRSATVPVRAGIAERRPDDVSHAPAPAPDGWPGWP